MVNFNGKLLAQTICVGHSFLKMISLFSDCYIFLATFSDAYETCSGSAGSLSLSRCQLFEAGYTADSLHLNDPNCKGRLQGDRLVFSFDSNANMCGTTLTVLNQHNFKLL